MGWYTEHAVPRIIDVACGAKPLRPLRQQVCSGLHGSVVEVGFGSGTNVDFYPSAVHKLTAVEPSDVAWGLAARRLAHSPVAIERAGLDGQSLPFDDDTFDSALSTFTLCTIPDPAAALAELRRVLKPGGTLHFLEHGLAPDAKVQRWQYRLDPVEQRLAGGCRFTRPVLKLVGSSGFAVDAARAFYQPRTPKFASALSLGVARAA